MLHRTSSLLLFLLLIPSNAALALDPDQEVRRFRSKVWSTAEGLPQSTVQALVQTHDGYLWMGTQEGLVRFDGVAMRVYDKRNTLALPHNEVHVLVETRDHTLWIGTDAGLARFRGETFENVSGPAGLAAVAVWALGEAPDGALWIGSDESLVRFQEGRFRTYTTRDGLPRGSVGPLAIDPQGTVWAVVKGTLVRLAGEHITVALEGQGRREDTPTAVLVDHDGTPWVGTDRGVRRLQDGQWTPPLPIDDTVPLNPITRLFEDREGALWVATKSHGVYRQARGRWSHFTTAEGLSDDFVQDMAEDREGNLWIGTISGGVTQLSQTLFTTFTTRDGLTGDYVTSVYGDREGHLWVGSETGLNRYQDGRFTRYTQRDGLSHHTIGALYQSASGDLLIGTGGGLDRLREGQFLPGRADPDRFPGQSVTALTEDHHGTLWVGMQGPVLAAVRDGAVRRYTEKEGLPDRPITYLLDDPPGDALWIGTEGGGVMRFQDGRFTAYGVREGLVSGSINVLHKTGDGTLWIGTYGGGLSRYREGRFTNYTTREGLYDDVVFAILEDGAGHFWLSCNRGIYRLDRRELEDYAAGRVGAIHSQAFDTTDGLKSSECNGNNMPSGWRSPDGRLWFPTVAGLAMADPARAAPPRPPPPVVLVDLVADERHLTPRDGLRLTADTGNLEIHYTAPSFFAPARVRFRYRLEGFDRDWIEAGPRRVAYYTRIPPGSYRFHVIASSGEEGGNGTEAAFGFVKRPHYYETWWFRVLGSLMVLCLLYGFHQVRLLRLRQSEARLSALVAERTRKLEEAHTRIASLIQSSHNALRNVSEWAEAVATDLVQSLGCGEIGIWVLGREGPEPLIRTTLVLPSLAILREASRKPGLHQSEGQTVVPAMGMTGEMYGFLVVQDRHTRWEDAEQRLLLSFAHQLGGALETQRMRLELTDARARWTVARQEILDRGIELLRLCPRCGRCQGATVERCPHDGSLLVEEGLLPYRVVERYRLMRRLGQGGMGIVFEAHDERLDRQVALKIIRAEYFRDAQVRLRFEQEARMLARIRHPGVIDVYDTGELPSGAAFIAMEELLGANLAEVLRRHGRGTPAQVAEVIAQGGSALGAAHAAGFIHRDIKPANIFLEPRPEGLRVRLLDFGLAKSTQIDTSLTQSGMLLGTPLYMSPEQVQGHGLDARSDLYSLAVVAYEALVGKKLIEAEEFSAVCIAVLQGHRVPPSHLVPGLPAAVDRCFAEALALDRAARPEHVGPWALALADLLAQVPADVPGWPEAFDNEPAGPPGANPALAWGDSDMRAATLIAAPAGSETTVLLGADAAMAETLLKK